MNLFNFLRHRQACSFLARSCTWGLGSSYRSHEKNRIRHGLFLANLALEKALKALVCKATRDLAPRIHNLVRLAELA